METSLLRAEPGKESRFRKSSDHSIYKVCIVRHTPLGYLMRLKRTSLQSRPLSARQEAYSTDNYELYHSFLCSPKKKY